MPSSKRNLRVVKIAEHDQFRVRVCLETPVNDAAQNVRLAEPFLGFVGFRRREPRFQMRGDDREREIRRGLDVHFREAAFDLKTPAVEQEKFVCVRMTRNDGKFAQDGDVDVRIETLDMFPKRKILAVGFERRAQFK